MSQRRPVTSPARKPASQLTQAEPSRAPTLRDLALLLKQTEQPDNQFGMDLEAIQAEQEPPGDAPSITSDQALRIARLDAERVYRDLSPYRASIALEPDGWHVDYELKDSRLQGGGPHYVIAPGDGTILAKLYEQ